MSAAKVMGQPKPLRWWQCGATTEWGALIVHCTRRRHWRRSCHETYGDLGDVRVRRTWS